MNAIDVIARGMAGNAQGALQNKADLVDGKVPASELPSYVDDVVEGYYYNGKFYKDAAHTIEMAGEAGKIYVDITPGATATYRWSGSAYIAVSQGFSVIDVTELPTSDIKENALYRVTTEAGTYKYGMYHNGDWRYFFDDQNLNDLLVLKQDVLVSGTNIKTVNGEDLVGAGNVNVKTYQAFPSSWTTSGTLEEVVSSMLDDPTYAKQGQAYLGGIAGSCTPFGYGNVECIVTFMTDSIALLQTSSSNIEPYAWQYNTASGDYEWKAYQNIYYMKDVTVTNTIGGLLAGFKLKGHTIENIIERLVGSYVSPSFTSSSLTATYNTSNTRSGATSYLMGDTVQLDSVALTLSKGSDYSGLVSGVIKANDASVYTLTQDELSTLSNNGTLTKALDGVSYTFPANQTSGNVTFAIALTYSQKSYDVNENIVTNNVAFGVASKKISAQDSVTYDKLYYGTIPTGKTIAALAPDGTVTYDDGTETFSHKSSLGSVQVVATDAKGQAAFLVVDELTDIKFMTNSDIANWTKSQETMSYTRENGTSYSKAYYIYTNNIASGTFTYVLQ